MSGEPSDTFDAGKRKLCPCGFRSLPFDFPLTDDSALRAELEEAKEALRELHAMVWGECPSLLDEDSGGCARLNIEIEAILARALRAKSEEEK